MSRFKLNRPHPNPCRGCQAVRHLWQRLNQARIRWHQQRNGFNHHTKDNHAQQATTLSAAAESE